MASRAVTVAPDAAHRGRGGAGPGPAAARPLRALVLANRLPYPLDDGWKVRTFHMVRGVAALAEETTLLVFHDDDPVAVDAARHALGDRVRLVTVPPPRAYTPWRLALGLLTRTPVHIWNQESRAYTRRLRELAADPFDLVVSESTFMARYLRHFPRRTFRAVDTHNVDSVTFARYAATLRGTLRGWYAARTATRLRWYEERVYRDADVTWVCSEPERGIVMAMAPGANVWVVPNGVDTDTIRPMPAVRPEPARLLFFGRLDYFPNVDALRWFASDMLPALRAAVPGLELWIVGQAALPEVAALAERDSAIKLIGRVDDVRTVLAGAAVVVVPLRVGGGTRLKILEALSAGRPTVATTIGAEGLELQPDRDLLLADTPDDFVAAVRQLLADPAAAAELGRRGRETVCRRYDWSAAAATAAASVRAGCPRA